MNITLDEINNLSHEAKARFVMDIFHRTIVHYAIWFNEVRHQMGMKRALEILGSASERDFEIQLKRLAEILGFEMKDNIPKPLLDLESDMLDKLLKGVATNWLVNDGVWFQAVEFKDGMNEAKRCNDSAWAKFSPFEAWAIKKFCGLKDKPGLKGLKKALNFRVYSCINKQSFEDDGPDSFIFKMNECRVQASRKRKKLDDYPCKSGGLVEYTYFARAIDERIKTECIGCPPDRHPEEWYCAWRFIIEK